MTTVNRSEVRIDINGLRGLSVLMVVLYHFNIKIFSGGFIGVDIFFVISGYLMTKIIASKLDENKFSYIEFISRRMSRIFPALFFMLFVLMLAGFFYLPPTDYKSLGEQILQSGIFNSNNYFSSQQGYFAEGADDRWLLHTWTLSVEWQFYMLYPLLLLMAFKINSAFKNNKKSGIPIVFLTIVSVASLTYCILQDSQTSFFSIFSRAWQMLAGGLIYFAAFEEVVSEKLKSLLTAIGLLLIGLSLYFVRKLSLELMWPSFYAIAPVIGTCLILASNSKKNIILANRVVQNLGSWSYSIYLWHIPVFISSSIVGYAILYPRQQKIIGIIISILLGFLSFKYIEKINLIKNSKKYISFIKVVPAFTLMVLGSIYIYKSDGIFNRVNNKDLYRNFEKAEAELTYKSECENVGAENNKFCFLNEDKSGEKILVIGDSHAGHLFPLFSKESKLNTTFFVKSGCPVIEGFERVGATRHCRDFSKLAFDLAASGKYTKVLIAQNWTWYSRNSESICYFENGYCVNLKSSKNPAFALQQTEYAILQLLTKNVQVAVLDATPSFDFNVPKKIAREYFWHEKIPGNINSEKYFQSNVEFDNLFKKISLNSKFTVFSLRDKICTEKKCAIFDNNREIPIFKDQSHFNPFWIIENKDSFPKYLK